MISETREFAQSEVMSDSLQPHGLQSSRFLYSWNFLDKNTGVGCHFLLQGFFLTKGLNQSLLCLLHWQVDSLPLPPSGEPQRKDKWDYIILYTFCICAFLHNIMLKQSNKNNNQSHLLSSTLRKGFPGCSAAKNQSALQETRVPSLG